MDAARAVEFDNHPTIYDDNCGTHSLIGDHLHVGGIWDYLLL
jgi:hypothetical protein